MSPRTHPNDEPARLDAVRAVQDAIAAHDWASADSHNCRCGWQWTDDVDRSGGVAVASCLTSPAQMERHQAQRAVEAARPIIEAEALNEAAAEIVIPGDSSEAANWLRAVAKIGLRR